MLISSLALKDCHLLKTFAFVRHRPSLSSKFIRNGYQSGFLRFSSQNIFYPGRLVFISSYRLSILNNTALDSLSQSNFDGMLATKFLPPEPRLLGTIPVLCRQQIGARSQKCSGHITTRRASLLCMN